VIDRNESKALRYPGWQGKAKQVMAGPGVERHGGARQGRQRKRLQGLRLGANFLFRLLPPKRQGREMKAARKGKLRFIALERLAGKRIIINRRGYLVSIRTARSNEVVQFPAG
jgi:hypothetical protein